MINVIRVRVNIWEWSVRCDLSMVLMGFLFWTLYDLSVSIAECWDIISCYGEELSVLDLLRRINMTWWFLPNCCLLFSCFLCCDVNEKCIETIYDFLMLLQWSDDAIYPSSVVILMNEDEDYWSRCMNDNPAITLLR